MPGHGDPEGWTEVPQMPGIRVLLELCLRQGRPSAVQALGVEEGYGAGSRK